MSRQNTVEIIVKTKDATGAGLNSVRKKFAQQGQEIQRELDKTEAVVGKSGTRIGESFGKGVADGAKDAGSKATEAVEKLKRDLASAETDAYKESARRRATEQKIAQRQAERHQQELLKAETDAYKQAARLRVAEEKAILKQTEKLQKEISSAEIAAYKEAGKRRADEEKAVARHIEKTTTTQSKGSADKAGESWASSFVKVVRTGVTTMMPAALGAIGIPAVAAAAGGALAFAGGLVGGVLSAGVAAGVVGLGAYLLKDNKQVKDAWSKTLKGIGDDSKKAAKVMADEFVASGKKTAAIWAKDVRPQVEGLFKAAQPLVDKFTVGLGRVAKDFLPGVKTAVENSGPVVEGFMGMLRSVMAGTGDGLADLSKHSESLKVSMLLAGEGIGNSIQGVLGFLGDMSDSVADNEEDFRRWGRVIGNVGSGLSLMARNSADLFAALGGDWKNGKGEGVGEALKKFVQGPDYVPPQKDVAGELQGAAMDRQTKSADGLRTAIGFLNHQKEMGLKVDESYIVNSSNLLGLQDELVGGNLDLANATGQTTDSNRSNLAAMLELAAAGYPVRGSLSQMVAGMNEAEIAGLNATITTDALGRSVIEIPGYKPITITADAAKAHPALNSVINQLGAIQDKYVTVRVNSVYSSTNGLGSVNGKDVFHDNYNKGGWVGGAGGDYDSVPAMLTPKEFVVNRKAAERHGALLERINTAAGGDVNLAGMGGGGPSGAAGGAASATGLLQVNFLLDGVVLATQLVDPLKGVVRRRGGNSGVFG